MNWKNIFEFIDGKLYWKDCTQPHKNGSEAGCLSSDSYIRVRHAGVLYLSHHIIYEMHMGAIPPGMVIDHDDRNKQNNYPYNLIAKSQQNNTRNQTIRKNSPSGVTGVRYKANKDKWQARITVDGKEKHLGYFTSKDAAIAAREEANVRYGFHKNHGKPNGGSFVR